MISEELHKIWDELPTGSQLVAISKYHPSSAILEAYECGQRVFGENHVQELIQKASELPTDIEWHFTGHLQSNKVKYIAPFISLIHSVDSFKLLKELDKQGRRAGRKIRCLLELHIAEEDTKYGFTSEELDSLHQSSALKGMEYVEVCGLMSMATNTDDETRISLDFSRTKHIFDELKERYYSENDNFRELSMGMSDDYHLALAHGSTMIRIGTRIFGGRDY